jgi:hypothetical protein
VGCGPTIFLFDWLPKDWISQISLSKFRSLLEKMRPKLPWLWKNIPKYLDDNARNILSTIGQGIVSHIIMILMS